MMSKNFFAAIFSLLFSVAIAASVTKYTIPDTVNSSPKFINETERSYYDRSGYGVISCTDFYASVPCPNGEYTTSYSSIMVCQPYTYCCNSVYKVAKCIDYKYCGCVGPDTVDCTHFFEQDCYTFETCHQCQQYVMDHYGWNYWAYCDSDTHKCKISETFY